MGLPSIDTYLHREIEDKLKIILSNRYIIEEILRGIQPDIAQKFIKVYGDLRREIPIVYTLSQEKVFHRAAIYIGLKEGVENSSSLGNLEGNYEFKKQGVHKDKAVVDVDGDRLFMEVKHPVGRLISVENLMFSASDNVTIEGNRIYFRYDPELVGLEFYVNYESTSNPDEVGIQKGFTAREQYSIVSLSTNMDTVRCLDLILKAILIMMRDNTEEQSRDLLQNIQFGQLEEVDLNSDENNPMILYGREIVVTYTTTYSLDVPLLEKLKEIRINIGGKSNQQGG